MSIAASEKSHHNADLAKINTVKEIKITRDTSYNDQRSANMVIVEGHHFNGQSMGKKIKGKFGLMNEI